LVCGVLVLVLVLGFDPLTLFSSIAMLVASSSLMMHSLAWLYYAKCISEIKPKNDYFITIISAEDQNPIPIPIPKPKTTQNPNPPNPNLTQNSNPNRFGVGTSLVTNVKSGGKRTNY
jgi:hypothetical protein